MEGYPPSPRRLPVPHRERVFTMKEVDRLKTIEALAEGRLTASIAAQRLGMSPRQGL